MFDAIHGGRPLWIGSREEYAARYPELEQQYRPEPAPPIAFAILPYFIDGAAAGCLSFVFHDERRLTSGGDAPVAAGCEPERARHGRRGVVGRQRGLSAGP